MQGFRQVPHHVFRGEQALVTFAPLVVVAGFFFFVSLRLVAGAMVLFRGNGMLPFPLSSLSYFYTYLDAEPRGEGREGMSALLMICWMAGTSIEAFSGSIVFA